MSNFIKILKKPITESSRENKAKFFIWIIFITTAGLFGCWYPVIVNVLSEKPLMFGIIIINGSMSTFCLSMLMESMINMHSVPGSGKTEATNTLRSFVLIISILVLLLNSIVYGMILTEHNTYNIKLFTIILTVITFLLASYLYFYRSNEWEKSVDKIYKDDDKKVEDLVKRSDALENKTDEGIEL